MRFEVDPTRGLRGLGTKVPRKGQSRPEPSPTTDRDCHLTTLSIFAAFQSSQSASERVLCIQEPSSLSSVLPPSLPPWARTSGVEEEEEEGKGEGTSPSFEVDKMIREPFSRWRTPSPSSAPIFSSP